MICERCKEDGRDFLGVCVDCQESLRADAERLAWLEGQGAGMPAGYLWVVAFGGNAGWALQMGDAILGRGPTLAAAIDEARGKEGTS